jgi:peptidyl-prolyl cis-trans isomerase A (cyclophilin A)
MKTVRLATVLAIAALIVSLSSAGPLWAQEKAQEKSANPMVLFKTTLGSFKVELYPTEAPITVKNFLDYVDKKFYDGTTFHRIVPGFVIQGGGFDKAMMKKATSPPIKNEANNGLKNLKGTLSMARTPEINSATSQFFVNLVNNATLDHTGDAPAQYGYAVFGKVVQGFDVIEKIAAVKTVTKGQYQGVPASPVVILSVTRISAEKEAPKAPKEK